MNKFVNYFLNIFISAAMAVFIAVTSLNSQTGVGVDMVPSNYLDGKEKNSEEKTEDLFVKELAVKMNISLSVLEDIAHVGYGRTEMVVLILIHRKAEADFDELIRMRDKMAPLRRISEIHRLPYNSLKEEAGYIKLEIESLIYSDGYQEGLQEDVAGQFEINSSSGTENIK